MKRWLLLLLLLAAIPAWAEEAPPALTSIREASSLEEALPFLILAQDGTPAEVQRGYIRYVSQDQARDEAFCKSYWLGGEEGTELDLTMERNRYGHAYTFHSGVMCTRAAYSMALSYLGIEDRKSVV